MGRRSRVNYDEIKTVFVNQPSSEAIDNYFKLLISTLVDQFGKEIVLAVLLELQKESKEDKKTCCLDF